MGEKPSLSEFAEAAAGQELQPYQRALLDAIEHAENGGRLKWRWSDRPKNAKSPRPADEADRGPGHLSGRAGR